VASQLQQGTARSRPPRGRSQAHPGVHPIAPLTHRTQRFQPLPEPLREPPYHYTLESAIPDIETKAKKLKKLIFHVPADVGGVKHPEYQRGVAAAMKGDLNLPPEAAPSFMYIVGDVVYFDGEVGDYYDQFYEPYDQYNAPIFAIPGNHDGDPIDDSQTSLDGFVRYFMSPTPIVQPESKDAPRVTMSLPNVFFTLECPFVDIVGMYTNVPEHGSIDSVQQQWLTNEFATAPKDKALIVALHHPIYSFDDHHSGSARMADAVQHAINDSRRVPNIVLTGHVHNYQRIEKEIAEGKPTPFLVLGNGGYWHLHGMNAATGHIDQDTGASLVFEEHKRHGYVTLTVDADHITGTLTLTDPVDQDPQRDVDTFSYTAKALHLKNGVVTSL
jgi:acid phosphatase type 7